MAIELIPHPLALPGACFKCRCGSENRDWFIDLGFSMDDYGAVIICNECVIEMAYAAGMITSAHADQLNQKLSALTTENEELKIRNEGLEQAVDGLRLAGSGSRTYSNTDLNLAVPESSEVSGEREEVVAGGTEGTLEPLHDEGMAIIPDDADSDSGGFQLNI